MSKGSQAYGNPDDPKKPTARKRTDTQIAMDRQIISELHYKGLNDTEITAHLNNRENVNYTLSRRMVTRERNLMIEQAVEAQQENTQLWIAQTIAELEVVKREAWKEWERSLTDAQKQRVERGMVEVEDGDGHTSRELQVTKMVEYVDGRLGDTRYLSVVLECIEKRNKLRGLNVTNLNINQRVKSEHTVKVYQSFDPGMWDSDKIQVVDGEIVQDGKVVDRPQLTKGEEQESQDADADAV